MGNSNAHTAPTKVKSIAPERDYMKSANSIIRLALEGGLFRGKSKQIYDFLYSKSRGAVVPRLSVQLSRSEIMRRSHVGSTHTLRDNLQHLKAVGLVTWTERPGQQEGNEYFVHLPDEVNLPFDFAGNPVQSNSPDHPDHPGQNQPRPLSADSAQPAQGLSEDITGTYSEPKTFSKTFEYTDDEAFTALIAQLKIAAIEITGKEPAASEAERWRELGELLTTELRAAAERTTVVSSVPALLTEHLRRRLSKPATPTKPVPVAPPAHTTERPAPPTDEELVSTFVDFLHSGMTLSDLDDNLSKSVEEARWPAIRAQVVERYERERAHTAAPGASPTGAGN